MDFGDLVFFIVFVIIIVSNILKQLKKADSKTAKKETPAKKGGWKNALEIMLEEARKQMEESAGPEPEGSPIKRRSGWDDIISEEDIRSSQSPETPGKADRVKLPRQPVIPQEPVRKKEAFRPECLRCNAQMKQIEDLGTGVQKGLVYCDRCGEQHLYEIVDGELKLKPGSVFKSSDRRVERQYQLKEAIKEKSKSQCVEDQQDFYAVSGTSKAPPQMSQQGLRNAVVWAEILAPPLGLRDLER